MANYEVTIEKKNYVGGDIYYEMNYRGVAVNVDHNPNELEKQILIDSIDYDRDSLWDKTANLVDDETMKQVMELMDEKRKADKLKTYINHHMTLFGLLKRFQLYDVYLSHTDKDIKTTALNFVGKFDCDTKKWLDVLNSEVISISSGKLGTLIDLWGCSPERLELFSNTMLQNQRHEEIDDD